MCRTPSILDSGLFYDKAGGTPGMYSQVVEVPKYKEKTTTTGMDRHIPVWPLVEQDWAGAREGMRALCSETGSRE